MSLEKAKAAIQAAKLSDNDRKWFPSWLARYAAVWHVPPQGLAPVDRERVIQFLRTIKAQGKPAWQRLPAARADVFSSLVTTEANRGGRGWARTRSRSF